MPNRGDLYLFNRNLFWYGSLGAPGSICKFQLISFLFRLCLNIVSFCEIVPLLLAVNIGSVAECLKHFFSFFWMNDECHTLYPCVGYYSFPLIFQWAISLISVWLSHKFSVIASEKYTPLCFLLDHSIPLRCVDRHQFSLHFLSRTGPLFLVWRSQKYLVKFLDFFWLDTQLRSCLCLMLLLSKIPLNASNKCIKVLQPWTHFLLYSENSVGEFWPSFAFC